MYKKSVRKIDFSVSSFYDVVAVVVVWYCCFWGFPGFLMIEGNFQLSIGQFHVVSNVWKETKCNFCQFIVDLFAIFLLKSMKKTLPNSFCESANTHKSFNFSLWQQHSSLTLLLEFSWLSNVYLTYKKHSDLCW